MPGVIRKIYYLNNPCAPLQPTKMDRRQRQRTISTGACNICVIYLKNKKTKPLNNHDHIPADIEQVERFFRKEMPPEEREAFLVPSGYRWRVTASCGGMQLLSIGIQEAALQRNLDQFHKEMPALRPAKRNVFQHAGSLRPQSSLLHRPWRFGYY